MTDGLRTKHPDESLSAARRWRTFYRDGREAGLTIGRAEDYADRLYHALVNGGDLGPIFSERRAETEALTA